MQVDCPACDRSETAALALAERGARLTGLRRDVLQELHHADRPLGAYDLFHLLKQKDRASAPPAVYRVLDFLVEIGLAHKLRSLSAYSACREAPHPHQAVFLICRACGNVQECEGAAIDALRETALQRGFRPEHATLELTGLCRDCA